MTGMVEEGHGWFEGGIMGSIPGQMRSNGKMRGTIVWKIKETFSGSTVLPWRNCHRILGGMLAGRLREGLQCG